MQLIIYIMRIIDDNEQPSYLCSTLFSFTILLCLLLSCVCSIAWFLYQQLRIEVKKINEDNIKTLQ